jgi:hypothetical protein
MSAAEQQICRQLLQDKDMTICTLLVAPVIAKGLLTEQRRQQNLLQLMEDLL